MVGSIASSPAVDLSTLPAPTIVEQPDFEARLADRITRFRQLYEEETGQVFDALVESDPAMKLLETSSYVDMLHAQAYNEVALARLLAFARGSDLDHLGALMDVARLVVTPASGDNPAVLEGDTAYKRRIQLAPHAFSVAGPQQAYVFHALSADADVADATAISPTPDDIRALVLQILAEHDAAPELVGDMAAALDAAAWPGDVSVTLVSASGDGIPSAGLIATVDTVLQGGVRPLTDHVTVRPVELVDYVLEAELYVFAGPDQALVLQTAQASLAAHLASIRRLDRDVARTAQIAALHVGNVQRVNLISPPADIPIGPGQLGNCVSVTVSIAGTML